MKPRILFICKRRLDDYKNSFGLFNSASFVANFLNSKGIEAKAIMVVDGNAIDREIVSYNPTHVVIEAMWVISDKLRELLSLKRHKNRTWIVRIHSKIPFLANEGIAFSWLNKYVELTEEFKNFIVAPNNKEVARDLKETLGLRTVYLPNVYLPFRYDFEPTMKEHKHIDVGCFGAIRPMKNQLIQAIAAIKFANRIGKNLRFHINGGRQEQKGDQVYKNLVALFEGHEHHKLIIHPWMPHDKFVHVIRKMDIGLQVSLSETFNIVAADFVDNNIPIIGSYDIEWLPRCFKTSPNSSTDIMLAMIFTWQARKFGLHYLNRLYLYLHNRAAQKKWLKFLNI